MFWERYRRVVMGAGVGEGLAVWYRRHVERFIRFLKPRRLREATSADVGEFLLRVHRAPDTEAWQVRQADQALRLLYQEILDSAWAAEWSVPLPVAVSEVAEAVPSARLGQEEVFAQWGPWGSALERMVTALRYLHYAYRTEQTYVEWATRFVRTARKRAPEGVGALELLRRHLEALRRQHEADLGAGHGEVYLPAGLARKWPQAGQEWAWHWVFPSDRLSVDPRSGKVRRHHVSERRDPGSAEGSTAGGGGAQGGIVSFAASTCRAPDYAELNRLIPQRPPQSWVFDCSGSA